MNIATFTPGRGPIIVDGRIIGPAGGRGVRLLVDTGATTSLIDLPVLIALGFDPARDGRPVQIATVSGVEVATRVTLTLLSILGQQRVGFPVVARALPEGAVIDGLLGLDFLRGHVLTLDFRGGTIALA